MAHAHRQMNCCSSFTRAEALRAAADGANRGPREWDASMPVPAGTGMDRKRFLLGAAGGLLSVYGAGRLGLGGQAFSEGIARAASVRRSDSPILVSIFLAGGIDALSMLAPVDSSVYRKLRPTLGISESGAIPFTEDPSLAWGPSSAGFQKLHDAGKMIVMPGSGYADEDMSHFTSRHYWEVGATDESITTGWLGRYLDIVGSEDNPLQGLSMDSMMNPTLATARKPVAAIDLPESFNLWVNGLWGDPIFSETLDAASRLGDLQRHHHDGAIRQVAEAASEVGYVRRAMAPFRNKEGKAAYTSPVTYPTMSGDDFPQRLAGLAAMIHAGLPLHCVALTPSTQFDTHSSQVSTFADDVPAIAESIATFQADLEARGLDRRVIVHVWSEFGRRAEENGSGTDHGAAGMSMLIGSRVTGKMVGDYPSLTDLDHNGNQRVNVDFRGVYSSLLEQWFDHDPASVIPDAHRFPRYKLIG